MNSKEVVTAFFEALQKKDFSSLRKVYAFNAVFSNEIFPSLTGIEVVKMWEMLFKNGKELKIDYKITSTNKRGVRVKWTAKYTFDRTGRRVKSNISSTFEIVDGQIAFQTDHFNFFTWSRQALGWIPWMFSFLGVTKKKTQNRAGIQLNEYIRKNPN